MVVTPVVGVEPSPAVHGAARWRTGRVAAGIRCPMVAGLLLLAAVAGPAVGQDALVLGGGGALGLAHGGVLVAIDDLGYDPEIVIGTSMGANVGATFAAGYDGRTVWRIIAEEDWPGMFSPVPVMVGPERRERFPTLELDVTGRRLARGLLPDWRINRTLTRLLFDAGARAGGDFDALPRRFRAVATDMSTGQVVVLAHGDLARAVRASMAVPGVFAAIQWGPRLLFDGGVSNNLPTGVARELGAEWIIAVDVTRPKQDPWERDPIGIARRGLRLLMLNALPDTLPPDVLILPDIQGGLGEASFIANPDVLLQAGWSGAMQALSPREALPRARPERPAPAGFSGLEIDAEDPAIAALVLGAFQDVAPGAYDTSAVFKAMDRLYATGLFQGVWPSTVPLSGGPGAAGEELPPLVIRTEAQPSLALLAAAGFDNDRGIRGWAQIGGWRGTTPDGRSFGPLEYTGTVSLESLEKLGELVGRYHSRRVAHAWAAGVHIRERTSRLFDDTGYLEGERTARRAGAWFGREYRHISPDWSAALTFQVERVVRTGVDGLPAGWSFGPLFRIGLADSPATLMGTASDAEIEVRLGDVAYGRLALCGSRSLAFGRLRMAGVAGFTAVRGDAPADVLPALGDGFAMPGMRWGQGRNRAIMLGGADLAYPFVADSYFRVRLRAGRAGSSAAGLFGRAAEAGALDVAGAEIGVIWATPLGPFFAGAGASSEGELRLGLKLGPDF